MSVRPRQKKAVKRRRAADDGAPTLTATLKSICGALPITAGVGLLLLFASCALLLTTKDPDRYHTGAAYALLYLTAFLGGMIAVRINHRRAPILCGFGEGVALLLFITVLSLCFPHTEGHTTPTGVALLTRILLLPPAVLGAWLATRQRKKRRRH